MKLRQSWYQESLETAKPQKDTYRGTLVSYPYSLSPKPQPDLVLTAHGSQHSQLFLFLKSAGYKTLRWDTSCLFWGGNDTLGLIFSNSLQSAHSYTQVAESLCFHRVCGWQIQVPWELLSSSATAQRTAKSLSLPSNQNIKLLSDNIWLSGQPILSGGPPCWKRWNKALKGRTKRELPRQD